MEQNKKLPATPEFVAEMMEKLSVNFYETPEKLFVALAKTILWMKFTEKDVIEMVNEAIFTVKKTKITIADVLYGKYKEINGKQEEQAYRYSNKL